MKNLKLILLLLVIFASFQIPVLKSQSTDLEGYDALLSPAILVKFAPQSLVWGNLPLSGEYGLSFERCIANRISFNAGAAYVGRGLALMILEQNQNQKITIQGYRVQLGFRFYIEENAPRSVYLEPHFSYAAGKYSASAISANSYYIYGRHWDTGVSGGFQFKLKNKLWADIYIGGIYRKRNWFERELGQVSALPESDIEQLYLNNLPVRFKAGFLLGYSL